MVVFDAWQADPAERLKQAVAEAAGIEPARTLADTARRLRDGRSAATSTSSSTRSTSTSSTTATRPAPGRSPRSSRRPSAGPGLRASFLLALREETVAKLDSFKGAIPNVLGNYLRLEHLDRAAGRAAILGPIEEVNRRAPPDEQLEIEPALVEEVLDEVAAGRLDLGQVGQGCREGRGRGRPDRDAVPPARHAAALGAPNGTEGSRTLRLETLRRLGGAEQIVRDRLRGALDALSPEQQDVAAALFNHLVTPSGTKIAHGARGPRRVRPRRRGRARAGAVAARRRADPPAGGGRVGRRAVRDLPRRPGGGCSRLEARPRRRPGARAPARRRQVAAIAGCSPRSCAAVVLARGHGRGDGLRARAAEQRARAGQGRACARARGAAVRRCWRSTPRRASGSGVESAHAARTGEGEDLLRRALVESRVRAILRGERSGAGGRPSARTGRCCSRPGDDGTARIWRPGGGEADAVAPAGGDASRVPRSARTGDPF